jgi:hypothetical protein
MFCDQHEQPEPRVGGHQEIQVHGRVELPLTAIAECYRRRSWFVVDPARRPVLPEASSTGQVTGRAAADRPGVTLDREESRRPG